MDAPRHAPPWVFGVTSIPFGIVGGFCANTMPLFTRDAGISVENIGWFGAATLIPPMLQFLYAPIVDLGPRRKVWLVIVSLLGAACLCAAMTMPLPGRTGAFLAFTVAAQLISGLVGSCNGGLLATTMPNELRGRAGGWLSVGNLGGGALGSWVSISLKDHVQPITLGLVVATMMVVPALFALSIAEEVRPRRSAREVFGNTLHGIWDVARSRPGWTGMLFCMSPVGTAALMNYFSALAKDYHASHRMVGFVNGAANGLLTAGGALIGGYLCDRLSRRLMYLMSAALTAACGLLMALAPLTPTTYAVGVSAYLFIAGLCYAAFSAVVLEAIGKAGAAASTQYTLFTSAGNAAIFYVGLLDTRNHHLYGPKGLLYVDAGLNVLGICALTLMIAFVFGRRAHELPAQAA